MKRLSMGIRAALLISVLIVLALCNTSCSRSFDVTIPAGSGSLPAFAGLLAGDPIPPSLSSLTLPIPADLPTRATIEQYVTDAGFGFVLNYVDVGVQLTKMELVATSGTFTGLTQLAFTWQPGDVDGQPPAPVDLGTATAEAGTLAADDVKLIPDPAPDLLDLIEATHDDGSSPTFSVSVEGNVPTELPSWDFSISLKITVRLGLPS